MTLFYRTPNLMFLRWSGRPTQVQTLACKVSLVANLQICFENCLFYAYGDSTNRSFTLFKQSVFPKPNLMLTLAHSYAIPTNIHSILVDWNKL